MAAPTITTTDKTILTGESIAASEFFNAFDSDSDITHVYVQDFQDTGGSGYFTFDGAVVTQRSFYEVAIADISRLRYVAGQRGFERIRIMAKDSTGSYSSPDNTAIAYAVRANITAPYSKATSFNVLANERIAGPDIIWGYDPDGYLIDHFKIRDRNEDFGFFELNGVAFMQGQFFTVTREDLPNLSYVSTGPDATELFDVISNDGSQDSPQSIGFAGTIRNVNRPTVRYSTASVDGGIPGTDDLKIVDHLRIGDVDGSTMKHYRFYNTSPHLNHGDLVVNGVVQPRLTWIDVNSADIEGVYYDARNIDFTQLIRAQVFDGKHWSAVNTLAVTSNFVVPLATLTLQNTVINDDGGPATNLAWTLSATDGTTTVSGVHGTAEVTSVKLNPGTYTLTQSGPDGYTQTLSCTGAVDTDPTDGLTLAPGENVVCTFINDDVPVIRPELTTNFMEITEQLRTLPLGSLFTKGDTGMDHVLYEVYDPDADPAGGYVASNGIPLGATEVQKFTAAEFADVSFYSGAYYDRANDQVYVRANNARLWGKWTKLDIRTEPEVEDVLGTGTGWTNLLPRNVDGKTIISFSFMQQLPDYVTNKPKFGPKSKGRHFEIFDVVQRANARLGFRHLENLVNVQFIEVADTSVNVLGGDGGIIRMGEYGDPNDGAGAFAYFPGGSDVAGDMWFNRLGMGSGISLDVGGPGFATFLHELGHVMSLKHPHSGTPLLPPSTDFDDFTLMSYNGSPSGPPQNYQLYDIERLQAIYGINEKYNSGDDTYSIGRTWGVQDAYRTIWDGGGSDTLSAVGSYSGAVVDLRSGQASSIGVGVDNINIAFNAVIENGLGSSNDDQLLGNAVNNYLEGREGNDYLYGNGGDDFLIGGAGNDTFEFGVADGFDVIDELTAGGMDRLVLSPFPELDSLTEDLQFSFNGRDLLVDLNLNQAGSEGKVRIEEFFTAGNSIETLELNGLNIDLVNLAGQIDSSGLPHRFELVGDGSGSGNGLFVSPI